MKKFRIRLAYLFAALLIVSSLFLTPYYVTFAEDGEEEPVLQEALTEEDHSTFSEGMLSAAISRYEEELLQNPDSDMPDPHKIITGASLPYLGSGGVVALHIDFPADPVDSPNHAHPPEDDESALQNALSFLSDYYQRSSYGKLSLYGDAYSYSAIKPREEYSDGYELLKEAVYALDNTIDYSNYDADKDGRIDCIVMHIPHNNDDRWGSTWWSSCSVDLTQSIVLDGVSVASNIIVSRDMSQENGRLTLVHECGHAMGFPDYYSYDKEATDSDVYPSLTGTLTFDIMDNTTGDHNGFSKWVAGWLDDDDVIRVHAGEDGVYALRGGEEVGTKNDDGSITLRLESYDAEEIGKTGGIIVVSNDDPTLFSNYYMLQYDTYAGNEQLYYKRIPLAELSSGFRVFRVQAELHDGILVHSNTNDVLFNKLIELVDHDYTESHFIASHPFVTVSSEEKDPYGCMFYAGDTLTPVTDPSTNFRENINVGFTGIYMEFLESEDSYGTVRIWYSDEDKPETTELELELTSAEAIPGGYHISFHANQKLSLANRYGIYGIIDDMGAFVYYPRDLTVKDNTLEGTIYCDPDLLRKDSKFVFRFSQGAFNTAAGESPRIDIEIPVSQDLVELSESRYVLGTEVINSDYGDPGVHKFLPVSRAEDGTYYFYEFSNTYSIAEPGNTVLHKYSFTDTAPGDLKEEVIAGDSEEYQQALELNRAQLRGEPTERASIVPEGAELGEYPYVFDAVKIDDCYYVLSFREHRGWSPDGSSQDSGDGLYNAPVQNQLALSKLDANGKLIKQEAPVANEIIQDPSSYRVPNVMLQQGPNSKLAVMIYMPSQEYTDSHLVNRAATFFYDQDLNFESRLDNYSTGCGTWLEDGRYIAFTGRVMPGSVEELDARIERVKLINYDITSVIDPKEDPEPETTTEPASETPSGPDSPDTGDHTSLASWVVLICAAFAVIVAVCVVWRRKKEDH